MPTIQRVSSPSPREERRRDAAEDAADEEVCHRRLTALARRRRRLEADLDQARARASAQPVEQMRRLHGLLDLLEQTPAEELAVVAEGGGPWPPAPGWRPATTRPASPPDHPHRPCLMSASASP